MPAQTPVPFQRKLLLAATASVIVAVAVGFVVWFFLPPIPQAAYAKLLIRDKAADVIFKHPEAQADHQAFVKTEVAHIRSRASLEEALARPELADRFEGQEMDAEWLAQHLKVDFVDGPETLRLSLGLPNAEEARLLVAAVVNVYIEESINRRMNQFKERQKQLGAIHAARRKESINLAAKHEDLVAKYEEKRMELKQLEDRLVKLEVQAIIQRAYKSKNLEAILAQIRESVQELSERDAELLELNVNLDHVRGERKQVAHAAEKVGDEIDKLEVELKDPPRVQLLQPATIEQIDETPRRLRLSLLGALGTFAAMVIGFAVIGKFSARG
jgi:hypothetical protein